MIEKLGTVLFEKIGKTAKNMQTRKSFVAGTRLNGDVSRVLPNLQSRKSVLNPVTSPIHHSTKIVHGSTPKDQPAA